jgi:hypothetical protein
MKLAQMTRIPVIVKDDSVKVSNLHPKMLLAIGYAARIWAANDLPHLVITSGNDAEHMEGSLHYKNRAIDLRIWGLVAPHVAAQELRECLGDDFDVVCEKTHVHVEWDPV